MNQTCTTNEQSQDNGIQTGFEASLPKLLGEKLSVGGSFTYTHNWSNSQSFQVCTSESNTGYVLPPRVPTAKLTACPS